MMTRFFSISTSDVPYVRNRGTQYADLLKFLLFTYMRVGEATALTVKDYKIRNGVGYISITKTLSRAGNEFFPDTPKRRKSIRTIKLTKEAQDIIEKRIVGKDADELIWSQENGDHVKYTTLESPFKNLLKRAGIAKELSLHDLRHTGISFSLRHGAEISAVSRNAGHSSVTITQNIYQHVLQDERDQAIDVAEIALNRLKEKRIA